MPNPDRGRLLIGAYSVLFVRYCIATFLSSFFTKYATNQGISLSFNGFIFAAYPFGMSLTSIVAPQVIRFCGTRVAVAIGILSTSFFTLLFGIAPDLGFEMPVLQYVFFGLYFLNGLLGALAETACIMMVSKRFQDRLGTVMAAIGTVCGIGCMVGPAVGGGLFDIPSDPGWRFRLPFFVSASIPLLLLPFLRLFMPQETVSGEAGGGGSGGNFGSTVRTLLSFSVLLGLTSVALSGIIVATLDPTLSLRLSSPPFESSSFMVSIHFAYSSIVYIICCIPVGWLIDLERFRRSSSFFKAVTAFGFVALAISFALLAPFSLDALSPTSASSTSDSALNSMFYIVLGLVFKGVGSAFACNAVYPDLVLELPNDEMIQATISSLWNAAYSVGWAAGPLLGGVLSEAFLENSLCIGTDLDACMEGSSGEPHSGEAGGGSCSCTWMPFNGFDGFATSISLIALAYSIVLILAAFHSACRKSAAQPLTVAPLLASQSAEAIHAHGQ